MEHLPTGGQQQQGAGQADPEQDNNKAKSQKMLENGLKWLALGIFLMVLSFAINFALFDSGKSSINMMYVLSTLGAVSITKGLADILGF